jgi:molecular chaperone GrpE
MRSAADLENYRKRAAREKEDAVKFANASFLERLVPILDNFELGLSAAKSDSAATAIVAGLEMVSRQLSDFLMASGVEPVNGDAGTPFRPECSRGDWAGGERGDSGGRDRASITQRI